MSEPFEFEPDDDSQRVSRLSSSAVRSEEEEAGGVVREYQERYYGSRKAIPRSYSTLHVSDDERLWAAVAHVSAVFTFVSAVMTAGFSVPISIFVPLVIYLMFRKQSDYVAFHALQSFVLQLIGTVGALALLLIGGVAWIIGLVVALVAMVILIGFVLVPLWGVVGIALVLIVMGLPFAMLFLGIVGAVQTYNRQDFRYPVIARWVDRQLAGGFLNVI
ncbi:MAG: DUF4870 domain-containing protein [Anaerolineae bacterium]|nr:DUF4870 domain-containing protein [Anaerolineae bacterium]